MNLSNAQWAQLGASVWMGGAKRPDLCFVRGEGARLWDAQGREYLDFVGGWAATRFGLGGLMTWVVAIAAAITLLFIYEAARKKKV